MPTIAEQLASAPVTDSLKHAAQPADLTLIPWALTVGSWSEASGWGPPGWSLSNPTGDKGGLYLNTGSIKGGNAYAMLMRNGAFGHIGERQFSVYLFSAMGAKASGYHVTAYQTGVDNSYTFKLRRWVENVGTTLQEIAEVPMEATGGFAVVVVEGAASIWVKRNAESLWKLIGAEAADTTFTEGKSGFAGNGSNPKLVNFSTGTLVPAPPEDPEEEPAEPVPHGRGAFPLRSAWAFRRGRQGSSIVRKATKQPVANQVPWVAWFFGPLRKYSSITAEAACDASMSPIRIRLSAGEASTTGDNDMRPIRRRTSVITGAGEWGAELNPIRIRNSAISSSMYTFCSADGIRMRWSRAKSEATFEASAELHRLYNKPASTNPSAELTANADGGVATVSSSPSAELVANANSFEES